MAFPTALNTQITDAVSQANVKVLADAPAQATAALYQAMASAAGRAAQNAVTNQQNGNGLDSAATTRCITALLGPSAGRS